MHSQVHRTRGQLYIYIYILRKYSGVTRTVQAIFSESVGTEPDRYGDFYQLQWPAVLSSHLRGRITVWGQLGADRLRERGSKTGRVITTGASQRTFTRLSVGAISQRRLCQALPDFATIIRVPRNAKERWQERNYPSPSLTIIFPSSSPPYILSEQRPPSPEPSPITTRRLERPSLW